ADLNAGGRRIDDACLSRRLALRQRRSVFFGYAKHQRTLHAGCCHPRHVPERTPHRWGRSDVSLSAKLACALAGGGKRHGPPDAATAWAEGIARQPCSTRSSSRIAIWNWKERSSSSSSTKSTPMNSSPI